VGAWVAKTQADAKFLAIHQFTDGGDHVGQVNGIPEILHGYRSAQLGIKCTGERRQHNKAVAAPEIISDPKLVNPFCLCPLGQIDQLRKRYMGVSGQMELNTDFQCGHIRALAPG
jgi:hypothetical protein